jgi:hypothetical protein
VVRAAGGAQGVPAAGALGRRMLLVRRMSIVGVVALALAWALLVSPKNTLASIGLVAFAAMAHHAPPHHGGVEHRTILAARISLATGFGFWLYTLALPPILPDGWRVVLAAGRPIRCACSALAMPARWSMAWRGALAPTLSPMA